MTPRFLSGIATLATAMLVSCYPYPEEPYFRGPPPQPGIGIGQTGPSPNQQQQEVIRQQELARQQPEAPRRPERREDPPPPRETRPTPPTPPTQPTPPPPPPRQPERIDYPVASPVVGKEGFVLSPYNNKQIDVRGIDAGKLVRDPTYPEEERKFFRVP